MKTMISLLLGVVALLALAVPAEAQYYRDYRVDQLRMAIAGYNRGYDPYYYGPRVDDPCDHITTVEGGALGAGGGALLGAAISGRRGAAIGAVGGAIVGGVIASRNKPPANCADVAGPQIQQQMASPTSYQEQSTQMTRPVAGPAAYTSGEGEFELSNSTRFRIEVYYDEKYLGRLNPGSSLRGDYPDNGKKYEAHMLVPNEEGGVSSRPAKIVPGDNGLTFADPTLAER